jgi:uncharacterized membrane protein
MRVTDPQTPLVSGVLIITAAAITVAIVGLLLSWLMHRLHERLEHHVPRHRRQLEATYASFRRFLISVRFAAVRSLVE